MAWLYRPWEQLTAYSLALNRPWKQLPTSKTCETLPCCEFRQTNNFSRVEITNLIVNTEILQHQKKWMRNKPLRKWVSWQMCVRTEHTIKSNMGIIILIVAIVSHMLTLFHCELNPKMRMIIVVVGNSKSCVDTERQVKPQMKQESCKLIITSPA